MQSILGLSLIETRIVRALIRIYTVVLGKLRKPDQEPVAYPELKKLLENFNNNSNLHPDILYFGDSVLLRVSRDDTETDTLDQILVKKIEDKFSVLSIAHTAYHMQVYRSFISVLQITKAKPKIVILPINLRSFSPQWDFHPSWQFENEIRAIKKYQLNTSVGIPSASEVPANSTLLRLYDAIPVKYPLINFKRIRHFRNVIKSVPKNEEQADFRHKSIFIFHYMHLLLAHHPRLVALEEILKMLCEMGITTILYVSPVNWQSGKKYVGHEFVKAVKSNVDIVLNKLSTYLAGDEVKFADYSDIFESDCFFSNDNATEHLSQSGRRVLADHIKKMIIDSK